MVNVSEGRDVAVLEQLSTAAAPALLDVHRDPHHHRSVFTLAGPSLDQAVRALADVAVSLIDLRRHDGVHPRLGAVDVVPFVALDGSSPGDATAARDAFARWWGDRGVPCFLYGPERTLPEVRRGAFGALRPAHGPPAPHPSAGATAVGVRPPLVAYNVWVAGEQAIETARQVAREVRGPTLRALGLQVGDRAQVSMNLISPHLLGPEAAHDLVATRVAALGSAEVTGAELVGLLPEAALRAVPRHRWAELDLSPERTIEARLAARSGEP